MPEVGAEIQQFLIRLDAADERARQGGYPLHTCVSAKSYLSAHSDYFGPFS